MTFLGQDVKAVPSAVSAYVFGPYDNPLKNYWVLAVDSRFGTEIARRKTDHEGKVRIDIPASGVPIILSPKVGLFEISSPESFEVVSKPIKGTSGTWDWKDSARFVISKRSLMDVLSGLLTLENILIFAAILFAIWFFFIRTREE